MSKKTVISCDTCGESETMHEANLSAFKLTTYQYEQWGSFELDLCVNCMINFYNHLFKGGKFNKKLFTEFKERP